jgi:GTP cyclohydrolase I
MGDGASIRQSIISILKAIGDDPKREGLIDTPDRVSRSYSELFSGVGLDPLDAFTTIFTQEKMGGTVVLEETPFYSFCEHHLLPFYGVAHMGYIPNRKVAGASKLIRALEILSRRLQIQERLTNELAEVIHRALDADGVIVVIEAEHLCMAMRGVNKPGARIITSSLRGPFANGQISSSDFMGMVYRV